MVEHMEERHRRTVSVVALIALLAAGCAGRYAGPRNVASLGSLAVVAGSVSWAAGESMDGSPGSSRGMVNAGLVSVAVGLAAIVAAGGWMAGSVACRADPDCDEEEQCREIPAPPGGIPYKQCMPR
jgi:hypothetical protein